MSILQRLASRLPIGERTEALLWGLGWTAPVAFISRVLSGLATLFAARWMGPQFFGEANLALAVSLWLQIPLLVGLPTALMHYLPQIQGNQKKHASAMGLVLMACTSVATLAVCWVFQNEWARGAGVSVSIFRMAMFWTAGFGCYAIVTSCLNALEAFRSRAKVDLAFALLFPLFVGGFWYGGSLNAKEYIIGFAIAYAIAALVGFPSLWPDSWEDIPETTRRYAKRFASYGLLATLNGVVLALLNSSTRLVANQYLSPVDLGVLAAYQGATLQMSAFILTVGAQVFFPIASRTPNRQTLFKKIALLIIPGCLASTALFILLAWASFWLLGREYPFDWSTGFLFSLAAGLATVQGFLSWFLVSAGRRGIVITILMGGFGGLLTWGGSHWAIPRWGLAGAAIAMILAYTIYILLCFFYRPPAPSLPERRDVR